MKNRLVPAALVAALIVSLSAAAKADTPPQTSPLLSAEDGLIFESAPTAAGQPIDGPLLAEAALDYKNARAELLASPAAAAVRSDSRQSFRRLNVAEAVELFGDVFGPELRVLSGDLSDPLLDSEHIIAFRGDNAALVNPDGRDDRALITSTIPLQTDEGDAVDASLEAQEEGFVPRAPLEEVEIPSDPSDSISLPAQIKLSLEASPQAADGKLAGFGHDGRKEAVIYANTAPDTDSAVISHLTGVRTLVQLRSPASPESTEYELTLPDGAELLEGGDGGAFIRDFEGHLLLSISAPQAVDAQGKDVPTTMSVEAASLILNHPHRQGDFAYPILVDPDFVSESRNWWTAGIGAGVPGWTSHQSGTSNYYISNDCPSALSSIDPCGGTNAGQGLFAGAKPNTSYPAGSKAWWSWTPPGGPDSYISKVTLNSWKYRKGSTPSTSPYAFYSVTPNGDSMNVFSTDGGGGNLLSGASTSRYFNVGLYSNVASGLSSGANNWRYARLAAFTAQVGDEDGPVLSPLNTSGVPTGWMAADRGFAVVASASDQGLGVRSFRSYSPWQTDPVGTEAGTFSCAGTYSSPCLGSVGPISLFFNSNNLPDGVSLVGIKALDAVNNPSNAFGFMASVDRSAPVVSTSGTATQATAVGTDLQISATDGSSSNRRSGIKSIKVFVEQEAPLPDLEVYGESLECVEVDDTCPQTVVRDLVLPAQAVAEGTAVKVVVKDQAGNTGVEAQGQVPEWEIEPDPGDIVADFGPGGAGISKVNLSQCHDKTFDRDYRVKVRANAGGGKQRVIYGTNCRDRIDMTKEIYSKAAYIHGRGEDDVIIGKNGNQLIKGGTGNDRLFGGMNNDRIYGGAGDDRLFGGVGDDDLYGSHGDDRLLGGPGADTHRGGPGADFLRGGQGTDKFSGGTGGGTNDEDTLSFADATVPGFNDQRVPKTNDEPPEPIVPTGMPRIQDEERGVYINLSRAVPIADNGPARLGGALDFLCILDEVGDCEAPGDIERIIGSAFSDYLIGSSEAETIIGGAGGDSIEGRGGDDKLFGGPGGDALDGSGTAVLDGGFESTGETNSCVRWAAQPKDCSRQDGVVIPRTRTATGVTVGLVQPSNSSDAGTVNEVNVYVNGSSGPDSIQARYDSAQGGKVVITRMAATGAWPGGGKFTSEAAGVGCTIVHSRRVECPLGGKPVGSAVLSGGPGKDNLSITGFEETDEVYLLGGLDQDRLSGGRFNDVLVDGDSQGATGPPGEERLEGGAGDDVLIANKGRDKVLGGVGGDLLMSTSLCDGDSFFGGPGDGDNSQWAQLPRPPDEEIIRYGVPQGWPSEDASKFGIDVDLVTGRIGRHERGVEESQPVCRAGDQGSWPHGGTIAEVVGVERVEASGNPDKIVGDEKKNSILGRSGKDDMWGGPGVDKINAAEGRKPWHMDSHIDCGEDGGSASTLNGGDGLTESPTNCTKIKDPVARYGKPPPPPYTEVGDVGPVQAAYMGEVNDSEGGIDNAGILASSWEDEAALPSALYSLNETSGADALDFLDPAESGTYTPTPEPAGSGPELGLDGPMLAAPESEAVGLDGTNDKVELTAELDPADSAVAGYSVELWTKIDPSQPLSGTVLYSRDTGSDGVELYVDSQGEIAFESKRDSISRSVRSFGFEADDEYHHLVATIEGDQLALFIDGVESVVGFDASVVPGPTPAEENIVGADGSSSFTEMEVDTVAIYEAALSLPDVLEKLALGREEPPEFVPLESVDTTNSDADSYPDEQDNCSSVTNEDQQDEDFDGIGDACDNSIDTDGDTVDDNADNCPGVVNSDQTDSNSDGVGDMCTEVGLEPEE